MIALHEDVEDHRGSEEEGAIPGRKGQDYPVYKVVPTTTFTCAGRLVPGYYADPDTRCQVLLYYSRQQNNLQPTSYKQQV